jgi:hypothetical protein
MLFCEKHRGKVKKNNPDNGMIEITTLLAAMWKETDAKGRSSLKTKATKGKEKYDKEMEKYRQTDSYAEFQKKKQTHDLIAKFASEIAGVKKNFVIKFFHLILINPSDQRLHTSCTLLIIEMLFRRNIQMQV